MSEVFDLNDFIESLLPTFQRSCRGTVTFKPKPLQPAYAEKKRVEAQIKKQIASNAWIDVIIGTFEYREKLHILINGVSEIEVPT